LAASALAAASLLTAALLDIPGAQAGIGIERVSRSGGSPGDPVLLALGCGACYPPCEGPKGDRHPAGFSRGTCMLGTRGAPPPRSFGVSLLPVARVPKNGCGACPPRSQAPPDRAPFTLLGRATPPPGGNDPTAGTPRYLLRFEVPDLRPGLYAFVVHCEACLPGPSGSLITYPVLREWRFRVRPEGSVTRTASWLAALLPGWAGRSGFVDVTYGPYLGVSCRQPNSIRCGRVGIDIVLAEGARRVTAAVGDRTISLRTPGLHNGVRGKDWVGAFTDARFHQADSPFHIREASSAGFWSGYPPVYVPVRISVNYRDGRRESASFGHVFLGPGWG